jgi:hypothetical protein
MIGEIDLHGVLVTPLLVWMSVAYVLSVPVRKALSWIGLYRLVWHRALFDVSLLIVLTGAVSALANHWIGP